MQTVLNKKIACEMVKPSRIFLKKNAPVVTENAILVFDGAKNFQGNTRELHHTYSIKGYPCKDRNRNTDGYPERA